MEILDDFYLISGGYYMYIETSSPRHPNDTARLVSPNVQISNQARCLKFWYHMYGAHINRLNVYLRSGAALGTPVWTRQGTQGNSWKLGTIDITKTTQFQVLEFKCTKMSTQIEGIQ